MFFNKTIKHKSKQAMLHSVSFSAKIPSSFPPRPAEPVKGDPALSRDHGVEPPRVAGDDLLWVFGWIHRGFPLAGRCFLFSSPNVWGVFVGKTCWFFIIFFLNNISIRMEQKGKRKGCPVVQEVVDNKTASHQLP